jgi:phage baseplate assembly protein W
MARQSINIKFPFKETFNGGVFDTNTTTESALRDDLIALLTTKKRQRVMRSNLYSPLFDFLQEPLDTIMQQRLEADIKRKVSEFMPQIDIKKIDYGNKPEQNLMSIKITFSVKELFGAIQTVELNLPTNNQ